MIFRDAMNSLIEKGHEVKAFNAVEYNTKVSEKYKKIMDERVIHRECFNKWDRFFYHFKQRKIFKKLTSAVQIKNYDLIHTHTLFNGGLVAYYVKKKFGVPYVVSVRNTDINVFLKLPFFKRIANKISKEAAGVQFLSKPYKEVFIDKYVNPNFKEDVRNKSVVIQNGLEDFWLENKGEEKKLTHTNSINIIFVGDINKNKNVETTIKALEYLIERGYHIQFTVVGKALDENTLRILKNTSFVRIFSYLQKEELINLYKESDIFVMPSFKETFGRVYAEAMTQGLPVIYSKGQGFDGVFKEGEVGFGVPADNPEYIAESIEEIIKNYQEMSKNAILNSESFDWSYIANKLEDLYKKSVEKENKIRKIN